MTPYTQITSEERYALSVLRQQGYNQAEMARALGRHRSPISRELRRNVWRCNGRASVPSRAPSSTMLPLGGIRSTTLSGQDARRRADMRSGRDGPNAPAQAAGRDQRGTNHHAHPALQQHLLPKS